MIKQCWRKILKQIKKKTCITFIFNFKIHCVWLTSSNFVSNINFFHLEKIPHHSSIVCIFRTVHDYTCQLLWVTFHYLATLFMSFVSFRHGQRYVYQTISSTTEGLLHVNVNTKWHMLQSHVRLLFLFSWGTKTDKKKLTMTMNCVTHTN